MKLAALILFYLVESHYVVTARAEAGTHVSSALEIIKSRGFIAEQYNIQSLDGCPLSLYHVINPLAEEKTLNRYPVMIYHGLSGDATQMISRSDLPRPRKPLVGQSNIGPGDENFAFMLANNNYDVWLIDARGTNLNNHNVSDDLNSMKRQKFWNYGLDEQIFYDVPAQTEFVLRQTEAKKAIYITYSESTFFLLALLSAKPDHANLVAALVCMAPVAYLTHLRGLTPAVLSLYDLVPEGINSNYVPQPLIDTIGVGVRHLCAHPLAANSICSAVARGIAGSGSQETTPNFFDNTLKSTSIKALKHFVQLFRQKRFGMYDYGVQVNLLRYGQAVPPRFDLGAIRLPTIILFRGGSDFLSTPEDQQRLLTEMGTKPFLDVHLPHYNHLDYFLANNALNDVNIPILNALYKILEFEGVPLRDKEIRVKFQQPVRVVVPGTKGFGSLKKNIDGRLVTNLLQGLGDEQTFVKTSTPFVGYFNQPIDSLKRLSMKADRFGEELTKLPNLVQNFLPIA